MTTTPYPKPPSVGARCPLSGVDQDRWTALCPALTYRQIEVAMLMVRGASNPDIACELEISTHTAHMHTRTVMALCGVANRTALAYRYMGGDDVYPTALASPEGVADTSEGMPRWAWVADGRGL